LLYTFVKYLKQAQSANIGVLTIKPIKDIYTPSAFYLQIIFNLIYSQCRVARKGNAMNNSLIAINIVTAQSRNDNPKIVIIPEKALLFADFPPQSSLQMKIFNNKIIITPVYSLITQITH